MRRSTLLWLLFMPCAASLAACGGSDSAGGCQHAATPTTGPGDALAYFPAEIGRSWSYQQASGGTVSVSVTGTLPAGAESAAVFATSSTSSPFPSSELLVKRPWGVYLVDDGTADPVFAPTFPELILPFPLQVTPTTTQIRCSSIDAGDLDGDGRGDRADVVETITVVSVTETAQVTAGSFADVVHVQKDLQLTLRSSSSGSLSLEGFQDVWYAPGVGRVADHRTVTVDGGSPESDSIQLTSYALPAARLASHGPTSAVPPPARTAARAGGPASFEAAARRLAASMLGGLR